MPPEPAVRARPTAERMNYWSRYYAGHDDGPQDLLESLIYLKAANRIQDVEAALVGYLQHRPDRRAWMYAMLAVTLDHNLSPPEPIRQALAYAAIQAGRPEPDGDPEALLAVVDLMAARKWPELENPKAGEPPIDLGGLLDAAIVRLPHRPEPAIRSMALAEWTVDPARMAAAAETLLALGWPSYDAEWRVEIRRRVEAMAEKLREQGSTAEADQLMGRLAAAEPRDVFARLSWEGSDAVDIDLIVDEPLGATAEFSTPRTVFGGTIVQNGRGPEPEEIYTCPRGFSGDYVFRVRTIVNDPDAPVREATLEVITHDGADSEKLERFTIVLADPKPVTVRLEGGTRTEALPYVVPKALAVEPKALFVPQGSARPGSAAAPTPRP